MNSQPRTPPVVHARRLAPGLIAQAEDFGRAKRVRKSQFLAAELLAGNGEDDWTKLSSPSHDQRSSLRHAGADTVHVARVFHNMRYRMHLFVDACVLRRFFFFSLSLYRATYMSLIHVYHCAHFSCLCTDEKRINYHMRRAHAYTCITCTYPQMRHDASILEVCSLDFRCPWQLVSNAV